MTTLDSPSVRAALRSNALLASLSDDDVEQLAQVSRAVHAARGEVLWTLGSTVDFLGLATDGFVKMVRSSPTGADVTLELFGPTQIFGLLGTITGTGCPLSAMAVTDLRYVRIPKSAFMEIFERNVSVKDLLIRRSAIRLHGMVDFMARLCNGHVDERIAAILFILAESYGHREGNRLCLRVPLTRQEIGQMAGTTVESTIRTMSRWQKEGIIETDQQYVTIIDEPRLNAIVRGV